MYDKLHYTHNCGYIGHKTTTASLLDMSAHGSFSVSMWSSTGSLSQHITAQSTLHFSDKHLKMAQTGRTWCDSPSLLLSHLICIQEFFSPVFQDVLFALQETDTWKSQKIKERLRMLNGMKSCSLYCVFHMILNQYWYRISQHTLFAKHY